MVAQPTASLRLRRVVVLGANGAMGAGSAAMFAGGGCSVTLVAREAGKVEQALATVQGVAKSERVADGIASATYDDGLEQILADADLIYECVAEDMALKRDIFARIDAARPDDALVATVSSGLSIQVMAEGRSPSFRRHFAGIHLYNPPHMMTGAELIPHQDMPDELREALAEALATRFGRQVVVCADSPAFAGNRVGFKVMNEVAQLAAEHGVQRMDTLVGPYTGRAMSPLATIDLVGWDVHQAIVDNVYANVRDEAIEAFKLPGYMPALIHHGHLGDKTPLLGGFVRRFTENGRPVVEALDPATGKYAPLDPSLKVPFVEEVRDLHRRGKYQQGIDRFMEAEGSDADLARRVILGYLGYALNRCGPGEVVTSYQDMDRIMSAGFNWVPPSALVDLIGPHRACHMLERYGLPVPPLVRAAASGDIPLPLFRLPFVSPGRYFAG